MAKRGKKAERRTKTTKRVGRRRAKGLPRLYGNPFHDGFAGIGLPDPELKRESIEDIASFALGYFQELAARVKQCCSDKKATEDKRLLACALLVHTLTDTIYLLDDLAGEFELPFRVVAEESNRFPCLFPAHPESLQALQEIMWDHLNLGKRFPLKLRPAPGRKTFSQKTWVNQLLIRYILKAHKHFTPPLLVRLHFPALANEYEGPPLARENLKVYLNKIWQLLLEDMPEPEKDQRLRQLVERPSLRKKRMRRDGTVGERTQAHNIRASIKAKLGEYLKRMLSDSKVTQITT